MQRFVGVVCGLAGRWLSCRLRSPILDPVSATAAAQCCLHGCRQSVPYPCGNPPLPHPSPAAAKARMRWPAGRPADPSGLAGSVPRAAVVCSTPVGCEQHYLPVHPSALHGFFPGYLGVYRLIQGRNCQWPGAAPSTAAHLCARRTGYTTNTLCLSLFPLQPLSGRVAL